MSLQPCRQPALAVAEVGAQEQHKVLAEAAAEEEADVLDRVGAAAAVARDVASNDESALEGEDIVGYETASLPLASLVSTSVAEENAGVAEGEAEDSDEDLDALAEEVRSIRSQTRLSMLLQAWSVVARALRRTKACAATAMDGLD